MRNRRRSLLFTSVLSPRKSSRGDETHDRFHGRRSLLGVSRDFCVHVKEFNLNKKGPRP